MINRDRYLREITEKLRHNPIVSLIGPRQVGKTTLAQEIAAGTQSTFLDLEDPRTIGRLEQPAQVLEPMTGLVIIDEIQRKPDLFPLLRVLADRKSSPTRFLILGSASPYLVKGVSESLAGRVAFIELPGFSIGEVADDDDNKIWHRGGFPRSYLAETDTLSNDWRNDFIRTFLERDIPQLGISIPAATLRRFWTMIGHFHGQVWNAAELARSLGTTEPTARRYLDVLTSAFMLRQIQPWFENIRKRQVKAPKVYVRDSGVLHTLLSIETKAGLESHPKLGASWEGFVIEQILTRVKPERVFFWATHGGAELDLLIFRDARRYGVEIKVADSPRMTKSMHIALQDLTLERLIVIYPGRDNYPLHDRVQAMSLRSFLETW